MNFGFKCALLYTPDAVLTFQLRCYTPTGNASEGLGTLNWNVEPALLGYYRFSDRLFFEGELRDYDTITRNENDPNAGNVIRYGVGMSYLWYNGPNFRILPVGELVGWTVISGMETIDFPQSRISAAGDTIINAKVGVRIGLGELSEPGAVSKTDLYIGYGRALTNDLWYKNMLRVELRYRF